MDITEEFETKLAMCYEHQSQIAWMNDNYKDADNDDFFKKVRITAEFRGMQCDVKYAEAFRVAHDAFRISNKPLLPY